MPYPRVFDAATSRTFAAMAGLVVSLALTLGVAHACAAEGCSGGTKSTPTHHFSVKGRQIIAPDGSTFVPRGVNIFPWHDSPATITAIANCWQFNLVRLHAWILPGAAGSSWKDHLVYVDEPVNFTPDEVSYRLHDIRNLIEAYTMQGIVVILDVHERTGSYIQGDEMDSYLTFMLDFVNKFKGNPYVWLDLHNEPGSYEGLGGDFIQWRQEMSTILDTLKPVAPDMMMLVPGNAWGQDSGPRWGHALVDDSQSALLSNADLLTKYHNVLPTLHVYDQWVFGRERLQDFIERLYRKINRPLLVGEYGAWNNVSTLPASQALHDMFDEKRFANVGRVVWTWDALDHNDLTVTGTGGGHTVDSCSSPTNLTALGQLVWNDNHRR